MLSEVKKPQAEATTEIVQKEESEKSEKDTPAPSPTKNDYEESLKENPVELEEGPTESKQLDVDSVVEDLLVTLVDDVAREVLAIQDSRTEKDIVRPPLPKSPTNELVAVTVACVDSRALSPVPGKGDKQINNKFNKFSCFKQSRQIQADWLKFKNVVSCA
jgi:hypothetical protein